MRLLFVHSFITITSFVVIIFSLTQESLSAQSASLTGIVLDYDNNMPIKDVVITVTEDQEQSENTLYSTRSKENGSFNITSTDNTTLTLIFTHPDYLRKSIQLNENSGEKLEIKLVRAKSIQISGRIIDKATNEAVPLALMQLVQDSDKIMLNREIGTVSNANGYFDFTFNYTVPFKLSVSHISYDSKIVDINTIDFLNKEIQLIPNIFRSEEIIVLSDLVNRDEMKQTSTIGRISAVDVQQVASFDTFDLVSTLREVDVATQSMNMQTVSTRGFNTGANARFMQLTDGTDNQAPGLGFPVGNLLGPSELDIAAMELIVGPASTKYGSNAMNGALEITTRDPFLDQGISLNIKGGVNGLKLGGANQFSADGEVLFDLSTRIAYAFGNRLAFKFTGSILEGTDWRATNYDNIGWGESWQRHDDVPGYNGVNIYGDEAFVYLPVGENSTTSTGSLIPVTRTGYKEEDLVDYDIATRKTSASIHYKITPDAIISAEGRYGYTNTLYTSDSRIRLEDFEIYQFKTEFVYSNFFLRGYTTQQYSGNSYDVLYLANNLLTSAKSDEDWFRDFRVAYENGVSIFSIPSGDYERARRFADGAFTLRHDRTALARFEPGTEEFIDQKELLKRTYDFNSGAGIKDNSKLYNIDSGLSLNSLLDDWDFDIGANFRLYDVYSEGTIFPDTSSNNISNYQFGGFISSETTLLDESLNVSLAVRIDKNENFKAKVSPHLGLGYVLNDKHFFRFSYQYGFRYPTIREQFLNQNLGNSRLLGGLQKITDPYGLNNNSITEQAVDQFNEAVAYDMNATSLVNNTAYSRTQAEIRNLHLLENGIVTDSSLQPIKPETTHSFEIGYRQLFTPSIYLDLNYFVSFYSDFIGITRVIKPRSSPTVDLFTAAGQVNSLLESDRFYVNSNARDLITIHGLSFDVMYQSGDFFAGLNGTYSGIVQSSNDPIVPGFNTPPLKLNFEWGNRSIAENVGFKMIYRFRTSHYWQSPFLDGRIDSYGHFDFQVNVRIPKLRSMIKTGFTNLGVDNYQNVFGGPSIGSIVFTTFTFNPNMF